MGNLRPGYLWVGARDHCPSCLRVESQAASFIWKIPYGIWDPISARFPSFPSRFEETARQCSNLADTRQDFVWLSMLRVDGLCAAAAAWILTSASASVYSALLLKHASFRRRDAYLSSYLVARPWTASAFLIPSVPHIPHVGPALFTVSRPQEGSPHKCLSGILHPYVVF